LANGGNGAAGLWVDHLTVQVVAVQEDVFLNVTIQVQQQ
jgi:hypothetical protein